MTAQAVDALLSPWALGVLGLLIGSFLNVVVHRLPSILERQWWGEVARYQLGDAAAWQRAFGQPAPASAGDAARDIDAALGALPPLTLSTPRSRCPHCGHAIRWHENVPVLGWLRLRGRCAACGAAISPRYPIVEAATGALFAAAAMSFGATPQSLVFCAAIALMLAMALIDFDTTLLPDSLTLPLVGLGVIAAAAGWSRTPLAEAAIGAVAGYLSLWSVASVYRLLRGVEGMAEGDFRLLAGIGALLGWKMLLPVILLSSLVGAVVGIAMIVFGGHRREVPIPFGPYLAGGGIVAMFFGPRLLQWMFPSA